MITVSNREKDIIRTNKLENYINQIYWNLGFGIRRVYDTATQIKGCDVVLYPQFGNQLIVDEKSAISCWNFDLNTFAFEIYAENNYKKRGWFVNPDSITTHYMLIWVRAEDEYFDKMKKIEYCLISKASLYQYMKQIGITSQRFILQFLQSNGKDLNGKFRCQYDYDIQFVNSYNIIPEQPINMLLKKRLLISLSDIHNIIFY